MNVIVAGQRIVTRAELIEAALGFDADPTEALEFDSAVGQDALRDIVAVLEAESEADTDVDAEDLAYYRSLLGARVLAFPRRSALGFERGAA
ncbi:hypothetical protein GCM10010363_38780 [Streptomyces omiyaensis]|uniref:hypothetical protein n=1 Tax=Streptomyces omiyaensis TaxID=68247 RepID=UPI0016777865|nr:hypothetical protein [Streptomyces omiyaensis]GGY53853.1 hypothetical protein GCM10010363_38780 [Streptomyces omiyaensis]